MIANQNRALEGAIAERKPDVHTHPKTTSRVLEFDILRSVAILLLFFHHGGIYNFSILGVSFGPLSHYVELFLLGSFVFMAGYLSVGSLQKSDLPTFLTSRLVRIYIPYLAALGLFIGFLDVEASKVDLIVHILGAQILLSGRVTTPILTLWFIGLLLTYYGIFSLLVKSIRRLPLLILAFLLTFGLAYLIRSEWEIIGRRFFYYFFVYAAGILCARTNCLSRLTSARFFLFDKAALAILGVALFTPLRDQSGQALNLPLVFAITVFILTSVLLALSAARLLAHTRIDLRMFSFISTASFFAYLLHRPIWKVLALIHTFHSSTLMFLYLVGIGSIVILVVSHLLQKIYDDNAPYLKRLVLTVVPRRS